MIPSSSQVDADLMRVRVVLVLMVLGLFFLAVALWNVQVMHSAEYRNSISRQSIRAVRMPGIRGAVYDRNDVCLADNRPSYCVALLLQELRKPGKLENTIKNIESVVERLSGILGRKPMISREEIETHLRIRRPLPFFVWQDVGQDGIARWYESPESSPGTKEFLDGVDIYVEPVRTYPYGECMAHIMGYVGRIGKRGNDETEGNESDDIDFYIPEMIGKSGIELAMNEQLSGTPGWQLIRVDASGYVHEEEQKHRREAVTGKDVKLTIDIRIQKLLFECIGDEGRCGAGVVIDPRNGDILAAASVPTFDSNVFSPSISSKEWNRMRGDKSKPLLNRAISENYPSGSIFKPVVALAALENRMASGNTTFQCTGVYQLGSVSFRCWQKRGHEWLGMRKAIEQSCNSYFCQLGRKCGHEAIYHMARAVGLGSPTGIEIGGEVSGLVPDDAWKRKVWKDEWRPGDTCNLSIGQGALCVTPIQMAMLASVLANGGKVYRPRLIAAGEDGEGVAKGELLRNLNWSQESLRIVRGGMYDVIETETGTGKRARIAQAKMAGKTGTAEYGSRENRKQHTWMIVFAPFDAPRYAAAMLIEDGLSGGRTVAPRLSRLMSGIFDIEQGKQPASHEETVAGEETGEIDT